MTFGRYCPRCDRDTYPAGDGACSECGNRMPTVPPTDARKLLAEFGATVLNSGTIFDLQVMAAGTSSTLTKAQLRVLAVAVQWGRVLGKWDDPDLVVLRTAGFVDSEMLRNATGKASSTYLWTATDAARDFLAMERVGR